MSMGQNFLKALPIWAYQGKTTGEFMVRLKLYRSGKETCPAEATVISPSLIHAAANFAAFFAFRGLSINDSTFCFRVWK
jgi:hypothetical protein